MLGVKPRANGRYIVGQHLPTFWMLHVACCWELLGKVWKRSNFWANNSQHFFCSVIVAVSLAAVFWMSRNAPPKVSFEGALRDIQKRLRGRLWLPKRSATVLKPIAQLFQHCWGHASALHMVFKVLRVVFLPRCTAGTNIVGVYKNFVRCGTEQS